MTTVLTFVITSFRWCQCVTSVTRQLSLGLPGPPSPRLRSSSTSESSALHSSPLQVLTLRTNAIFRTDCLYSYVNPYLVLDLCLRLKEEKSLRSWFYNFGSLSRNFLKPLIRCWKILRKRITFVTWPPPQHISWRTSSATGDWRDSNSSSWWCLLAIVILDSTVVTFRWDILHPKDNIY